jgi:ubiquinone/menaquinone biosynthesis C-methylase UbiE
MNKAKAEFFDSQVDEPWASSAFGPAETRTIDRMLRQADLGEGMRLVEPGCGTGRLTAILAELVGRTGFVLASDISLKMIKAARRRIGSRDNVCLEHGAIEGHYFDPESFDVVICHNVFPHFDHKPAAVAHLASALRTAGKFIVFHFMNSAGINDLHRKAHSSVLNDLLPCESEMRQIFPAAGLEVESLADDDSGYLLIATRV